MKQAALWALTVFAAPGQALVSLTQSSCVHHGAFKVASCKLHGAVRGWPYLRYAHVDAYRYHVPGTYVINLYMLRPSGRRRARRAVVFMVVLLQFAQY